MHRITIAGVGLAEGDLTLRAAEALDGRARIILRTERCGAADFLRRRAIPFEPLDALYGEADDFDALARRIVGKVLEAAESSDVVYAVPDLRDRAAAALAGRAPVLLIPGVPIDGALSPLDPALCAAAADAAGLEWDAELGALIREIDTRELAGDVKLALMDSYPAEHGIEISSEGGGARRIPLCELDRLADGDYGHALSARVPPVGDLKRLERYGFSQLNRVVRRLRAPDGCPWDRAQTHESIARNAVEEAYEVVDAIDRGDPFALYDELGDLLLQVALHAEIARQHGEFAIGDVTTAVCAKLISRHEHIFGAARASTPDEVLEIWERAKRKERRLGTVADAMGAVTGGLPQLMRAEKVQKKAAGVGFDWDGPLAALAKVREEADEVQSALEGRGGLDEEIGDLLFACVNVARLADVEPELALHRAVDKFVARFADMERAIAADGLRMAEMDLPAMDRYWDRIKAEAHVKE